MRTCLRPSAAPSRRGAALLLLFLLAPAALPAVAADSASARYRFEGNKWLTLDLAVGDVHAEQIKFEWPATLMRVKTGYKATVKISNGSSRQVSIGIAVALFAEEAPASPDSESPAPGRPTGMLKLVGAGTTGTKLGTISPGESAQFSIDFDHVTQRLDQSSQFGIALEVR